MTNGMFHSPESFLQHEIAKSIRQKTGYAAFTEMSPRKISAWKKQA
jgi:hypothetical protein